MSKQWTPGDRLSYYAEDQIIADDSGNTVAESVGEHFGKFSEAAGKLATWLDRNPGLFYEMKARQPFPEFNEFFRCLTMIRGLLPDMNEHK